MLVRHVFDRKYEVRPCEKESIQSSVMQKREIKKLEITNDFRHLLLLVHSLMHLCGLVSHYLRCYKRPRHRAD